MKKLLSLVLALVLCLSLTVPALAAGDAEKAAADRLNGLGLFLGVGDNPDGTPNYDLDRAPNRAEAVTILVRLLGKNAAALDNFWEHPFTDVPAWAEPYVGYAYQNKLTTGVSATLFDSNKTISATEFLTFVLRALEYKSGTDFAWNSAWEKTNELGICPGKYDNAESFLRGDAALVASAALDTQQKESGMTLLESIRVISDAIVKMNALKSVEMKQDSHTIATIEMLGVKETSDLRETTEITYFTEPYKVKYELSSFNKGVLTQRTRLYTFEQDGKISQYVDSAIFSAAMSAEEDGGIISDEFYFEGITNLKRIGKETVNSLSSTKYSALIPIDDVTRALLAESVLYELTDSELEELAKHVEDVYLNIWISDTGYITRYEVDMSDMMTKLYARAYEIASVKPQFKLEITKNSQCYDYFNFNAARNFEIPPAAYK